MPFFLFLHIFFLLSIPASSQDLFFPGFKTKSSNLTLNGVTEIEKNGVLRLTNETSRLLGHAFYNSPVQLKNTTNGKAFSFSTSFAFSIVPEYPRLGGHGLAFTIATSTALKGALPSQYLGLLNASDVGNFSNHLFAVEFDTVQDFEFQDINDNHVGININSLISNASVPLNLTLKSGIPIQAWIDYDSNQNVVNVAISPNFLNLICRFCLFLSIFSLAAPSLLFFSMPPPRDGGSIRSKLRSHHAFLNQIPPTSTKQLRRKRN